jgi:hypothetical protein
LTGCGFDFPDSAKLSLDYHIDRPRLVALRVHPPVLQPDTPVTLETLYLDPMSNEPRDLRWEICGLRDDVWVVNFGLDCFGQPELVTRIGTGNPITWSPEPSDAFCEEETCGHFLPLLVTAEVGGEDYWASSMVEIYGEEVWTAEELERPTLRDQGVALRARQLADGRYTLEASVDARFEQLNWRWYVDDGTLYKTGRTATQGEREASLWEMEEERGKDARRWTDNVWELPQESGSYRAVVVVSGRLGDPQSEKKEDDWDEDDWDEDDWDEEKEDKGGRRESLYSDNPDQAWAIIEVVQP